MGSSGLCWALGQGREAPAEEEREGVPKFNARLKRNKHKEINGRLNGLLHLSEAKITNQQMSQARLF